MPIIKQLQQHKIVLDTHIWLWLMQGNPELNQDFQNAIEHCKLRDAILISPISIWEIGMLVAKKRISFEMDCFDWTERALSLPGIHLSPITPRIAIQSTCLPGIIHGDPADRILIATAHIENSVLVTCDQKILEFGRGKFVSVHNPCQ